MQVLYRTVQSEDPRPRNANRFRGLLLQSSRIVCSIGIVEFGCHTARSSTYSKSAISTGQTCQPRDFATSGLPGCSDLCVPTFQLKLGVFIFTGHNDAFKQAPIIQESPSMFAALLTQMLDLARHVQV